MYIYVHTHTYTYTYKFTYTYTYTFTYTYTYIDIYTYTSTYTSTHINRQRRGARGVADEVRALQIEDEAEPSMWGFGHNESSPTILSEKPLTCLNEYLARWVTCIACC